MSVEEEETSKPIMFLGKDVRTVPCFRSTMLSSITVGLVTCVGYCFVTGNFKKGPQIGIGASMATLLLVWIPCRFQYSYTKYQVAQARKIAREVALTRGTQNDRYQQLKNEEVTAEDIRV